MAKLSAPTTEETLYFNIALFPESKQFISDCIQLAQTNFASEADGYLLGDNAWPHITLCQFESNSGQLDEIWNSLANIQPQLLPITFDHFYIRPGRNNHTNKYWTGIAVSREDALILLQKTIYTQLNDLGIASENTPNTYFPHLTLALCAGNKIPIISTLPSKEFWLNSHAFKLSLGQSNKHGVYNKQLFSS